MFYVFPALASDASTAVAASGFDFRGLIPFVLILGVMYLFLIRPQQKKMKQHQEMVSSIRRGDRILTAGGLIGVIHKVSNNDELIIELEEGIRVRLIKTAITQVLAKTEPVGKTTAIDADTDITDDISDKKDEEKKADKKAAPRRKTTKTS